MLAMQWLKRVTKSTVSRVKYWEIIAADLSKPVGAWATGQPLIPKGEQSGLSMLTAPMGSVTLCVQMKY